MEKEIKVKQSQLDEMMAKIERLEATASKQRLANFDAKTKQENGKVIGLRMIDGKVVTSWSDMTKNTVEKSPAGVWKEDQQVELTYEDGEKDKMTYVMFMRRYTLLSAEVKKETKDEDGIIFKVETAEGKKYEIRDTFIN
jgi:hypothetical protein